MFGNFSKQFHRQTNFNFPLGSIPADPQYWPKEWKEIYHKEYSRFPKLPLPKNILEVGNLKDALYGRQSQREFDVEKELTMKELSTILFYTAGVKPQKKEEDKVRRFYPSGGARYSLEVYLLIQRIDGIVPGIYHFNVKKYMLEELTTNLKDMERLKEGLYYPWSRDAAVTFFITAVWDRNFMKYRDRGYRMVLMEAGHMAQNLALTAASLGIGCCNSVGFHNERINEVLDITYEDEDSLYMALLGRQKYGKL